MRVLFVYPNARGMNMLPPAIAIFSSLLKDNGHESMLFDTTYWEIPDEGLVDAENFKEKHLHVRPYLKPPVSVTLKTSNVFTEFAETVRSFDPQLIAVSATEDMFPLGIKLLRSLNGQRPPTILGGMFATFAPDKAIQYPELDMVCVGEGELPLLDLCRRIEMGMDYRRVQNLWVKHNGEVTKNAIGEPFDINAVPMLDLDIFEAARFYKPFDGKSYRTFPAETHRGCPYHCAYCNSPSQSEMYKGNGGGFFRLKSIDNVRRELRYFREGYGAEYIYFWADTFLALSDRYFDEFAEMYKSEINLPFWCQTRPETLTEKRVGILKEMGIHRMGLGLEHGNPVFREKMLSRRVTNKVIVERLKILNDYGVKYSVNNIIGFPTETRELAMDTISLNRDINADTRNMYTFTPFHGTPLRDIAVKLGYVDAESIACSLAHPTVLNMPQFSATEIEGLRRCFVPYVLLEKERWPEIALAEAMTPEGDAKWDSLMAECQERFFAQFLPERDDA
ncbi:anaerobic magnesium-protoporphyrin IX monomethyl ester cyclase [Gammaproteobacteria bacterium]